MTKKLETRRPIIPTRTTIRSIYRLEKKHGQEAVSAGRTCSDATFYSTLEKVDMARRAKLSIRPWHFGRDHVAAVCLTGENHDVIEILADCPRVDHECAALVMFYLALLRKMAHCSDAPDSSRAWAAETLLALESENRRGGLRL